MTIGEEVAHRLLEIIYNLDADDITDKRYIARIKRILLDAMEALIAEEE